jgi:hypothetical protein
MSIAVDREATRLWILNVGDLKPYEREIEFFLGYGWNATRWSPDNLDTFITGWAQREFDLTDKKAAQVTDIVTKLTRFNARRKPELLNSTTFSLIDYREYAGLSLGVCFTKRFQGRRTCLPTGMTWKNLQQPFITAFLIVSGLHITNLSITLFSPAVTLVKWWAACKMFWDWF